MLKFIKNFLTIMNPIAPHWTEYMYKSYLNPIFERSNLSQHVVQNLSHSRFPIISKEIDSKLFHYNKYIKSIIRNITDSVNSKIGSGQKGGKKGGKDKKPETEEKKEENQNSVFTGVVKIFYAPHFSNEQKKVYDILKQANYDDNNKILTDYKKIIMEDMKNSEANLRTLTLQFASFIVKEIETYGSQVLSNELPFDELEALKDNMNLIKKLTKTTNIDIVEYSDKNKPKGAKTVAIPGKPLVHCE
jgi:leucyl-tRNA synthetase